MVFKERVSTVAIWWPPDMTKALQQRWWYSSTTSLDYCWCDMNKPPITISNYHAWPIPTPRGPTPCYLWRLHFSPPFPPTPFPPLLLNSGSLKLPDGHYFQKEGKMQVIEGLEGGGGRDGTKAFLTSVLHISELMRRAEKENTKYGKGGKKIKDFLHPSLEMWQWEMSLLCYVCLSFVGPARFYTMADG